MSHSQKQKHGSTVKTQVMVQQKAKPAIQTLDQQRAAFIWQKMMSMQSSQPSVFDSYTKLSKGAGTLIMQNGLMPTLAFYVQKSKGAYSRAKGDEHFALLDDILAWLSQQNLLTTTSPSDAMGELCQKSSAEYRHITEESLALIRWIRQFASALNTGE